jgi:hypothetical protein
MNDYESETYITNQDITGHENNKDLMQKFTSYYSTFKTEKSVIENEAGYDEIIKVSLTNNF